MSIENIDYKLLNSISNETKAYMENVGLKIEIFNGIIENYTQGKVHFSIKYLDKESFWTIELRIVDYFKIPEEILNNYLKDKIKSNITNNGIAMVYPYVGVFFLSFHH